MYASRIINYPPIHKHTLNTRASHFEWKVERLTTVASVDNTEAHNMFLLLHNLYSPQHILTHNIYTHLPIYPAI